MPQPFEHLLSKVARRRRVASLGVWFFRWFIAASVAYALLLALALLSIIPDYFDLWTVALVPAVAFLGALVCHRGIAAEQAARLVDVRMKTSDLFLTAATIENAPGEYQSAVTSRAQQQAETIRPAQVVPYHGWNQASIVALSMGLLALGAWLLPTFDPFERKVAQQRVAQRISKLEKEKIAAKEKVEALKEKDVDAAVSKEVEKTLAELKKTFEQMKKNERESNLAKLNEQQKTISDKWRQTQEKKLENTSRDKLAQQLGGAANSAKAKQWKDDLEAGKTESIKQELQEIKQLAEQAKDPQKSEEEKKAAQQEAQKRMQEMSEFAKNQAGGEQMKESLQKALEQLAQSKDPAAQKKAMEAMKESMQLTEKQMEQMAQAIRDQKALEEAMQTIQNAKQANAQDQLDGQECKDAQSLREYAEKLRQKLNSSASGEQQPGGQDGEQHPGQGGNKPGDQQAQGNGNGKNGGGTGGLKAGDQPGSNRTPAQDISGSSAFRTEKSKSALQAGKSLMQWKTQEVTDTAPEDAKANYREAVEKVKQGVGEAILQEQIPPGYHETIQKYFDEVGQSVPADSKAKSRDNSKTK